MAKSVCIIGAGIGGLTAGALLANAGFNVTVLEKAFLYTKRTVVPDRCNCRIRTGRRRTAERAAK
ncbi:FAD-dependent oxidoreductase [Bacillus infantis]|uniref:FAD-dependent oxidoreductase n=1 Tax=Bacillus infantis TaxID=324767 RepID=UPI003CEAC4D9